MSVRVSAWRSVVEATRASKTADCGHRFVETFYLRVERVGAVEEVWSVCVHCKREDDFIVHNDQRPHRTTYQEI